MGLTGENLLIVIPARGGSKRVPDKCLRPMLGASLVRRALGLAREALPGAVIALTTDDMRIAADALDETEEFRLIHRPEQLAGDSVTLDAVIEHAVREVIDATYRPTWVLTLQPTSPTLRPESLAAAWDLYQRQRPSALLSVREQRRLFWSRDWNGGIRPYYPVRKNSQELQPVYIETGAFVFCGRDLLLKTQTRFAGTVDVYVLPDEEAIDIDTWADWAEAERILETREAPPLSPPLGGGKVRGRR